MFIGLAKMLIGKMESQKISEKHRDGLNDIAAGKKMIDWIAECVDHCKELFFLGVVAFFAGIANYAAKLKESKQPFSLSSFLGYEVIAGFSGLMTAMAILAFHEDANIYFLSFCVGMGAHMGGSMLHMLEVLLSAIFDKITNNVK